MHLLRNCQRACMSDICENVSTCLTFHNANWKPLVERKHPPDQPSKPLLYFLPNTHIKSESGKLWKYFIYSGHSHEKFEPMAFSHRIAKNYIHWFCVHCKNK